MVSDYAADQAERTIAGWILEGRYRKGQRLPGLYQLMEELGISYPTVSRALDRLRSRRLVTFEPGVGIVAVSLNESVGLDMLWPMLQHCNEPWRRWTLLCQFYDFIRPSLVDWVERAALGGSQAQIDWISHYTLALEDRHNRKSTRADIGHAEYELARVIAAAAGNICFTMTMNPLFELYRSDMLVKGTDTIVPPETYRSVVIALRARDGKKAGELLEAALWRRESECIAELRKLGWTAKGKPLDLDVDLGLDPEAA